MKDFTFHKKGATPEYDEDKIYFALDIGTHSVIGMLVAKEESLVNVLAIEEQTYPARAMLDGQIQDIEVVAKAAESVKNIISNNMDIDLKLVSVAAAGRTLKTVEATYSVSYDDVRVMTADLVAEINSQAIALAEDKFAEELRAQGEDDTAFYLSGYSIVEYTLDGYPMPKLLDHQGKSVEAKAIATFLPREVVESLYSAMRKAKMDISTLTLEPIAAMNAVIPSDIRLLNLALVDIGAGTSDIAIARDGSIIGYTMATIAGDEITEAIMKSLLIDFKTAEDLKIKLSDLRSGDEISYIDVLGLPNTISVDKLTEIIEPVSTELAERIVEGIVELNKTSPSAVFMVGGGSKLPNLCNKVATLLELDSNRVALGGNSFAKSAYSNNYEINNPIYATPLGIALSASFDLNNEGFNVTLNGKRSRIFRSGNIKIFDVLLMNGYHNKDLMPRGNSKLVIYINGHRKVFHGDIPKPAIIKLNGEDASPSTLVNAGDRIEFEPAHNSPAPIVYLSEITETFNVFNVIYNGANLQVGDFIVVYDGDENGEPTKENPKLITDENTANEYLLTNGTSIELVKLHSLGDLKKFYEITEDVVDGNRGSGDESLLYDGMEIIDRESYNKNQANITPKLSQVSENNLVSKGQDTSKPVQSNTINNISGLKKPYIAPTPPRAENTIEDNSNLDEANNSTTIRIRLNDQELELERKQNNEPHMLIDLLNETGLDFEKPKSGVVLSLNGENAGFTDTVKNGDVVNISWAE